MRSWTAASTSIVLLFFAAVSPLLAEEGMWLFSKFPKQEVKAKYGFTVTDSFLENLQAASVRFSNGGSGSFVSGNGLLFTNHHVAADCIFKVSSKQNDFMKNGFLAKSLGEERPCPDLEVNVLVAASTVTDKVNAGTSEAMPAAEANRTRLANIAKIEQECTDRTGRRCQVTTLYSGGQYELYEYKKYNDVRLVMAPEEAVAAFGGDPDNFTYPRFCLDFTLLRAYEQGKPARPKNFLRFSPKGVQKDELIFVSGHPGSTQRLATVAALEFQRDLGQGLLLEQYSAIIRELLALGQKDPESKRQARDLLAQLQNSVKARTGFLTGLREEELMRTKREAEAKLRKAIADDPTKQAKYGKTWDEVADAYAKYREIYVQVMLLERTAAVGSESFKLARDLIRYAAETKLPNAQRLREWTDAGLDQQKESLTSPAPIYDAVEVVALEQYFLFLQKMLPGQKALLDEILQGRTARQTAEALVKATQLKSLPLRKAMVENPSLIANDNDPMLQLARLLDAPARAVRKQYEDTVEATIVRSASRVAAARYAVYGDKEYPDATFTLRLTYAPVSGYTNRQGQPVNWSTDFAGLYARATGKEPFALPERWVTAQKKLKAKTPFNFVSTADTHGGNSGSPTVNRKGEVVGILFDGNLESLPNQYLYRDRDERSVHLSSQAVLESLRAIYGATELVNELLGK